MSRARRGFPHDESLSQHRKEQLCHYLNAITPATTLAWAAR
jgi:hypothetical protein